MKIIPALYVCEICDKHYDTQKEALECEAQKQVSYPVGLIYGHTYPGDDKRLTVTVMNNRFHRHGNYFDSWVCRLAYKKNKKMKDTIEDIFESKGVDIPLGKDSIHPDFEHPTFRPMVEFLKSKNIQITIWNGKEAVPYVS